MPGNGVEMRMLERRVSNNRSDLDGDQKINYFISWFSQWSDLQKSDFVNVLSEKMSGTVNGVFHDPCDSFGSMSLESKRAPSLYDCQVKLFREWFSGWSDDQKNYLVMRLRDIDVGFFSRFEGRMSSGGHSPVEKDYFEPGVPDELMKYSTHMDSEGASVNMSVHAELVEVSDDEEDDGFEVDIKEVVEPLPRKSSLKFDAGSCLDTINEDSLSQENDGDD